MMNVSNGPLRLRSQRRSVRTVEFRLISAGGRQGLEIMLAHKQPGGGTHGFFKSSLRGTCHACRRNSGFMAV